MISVLFMFETVRSAAGGVKDCWMTASVVIN